MEVTQKTCLPSVQKYSITLTQLFIFIMQKDIGYAKRKEKTYPCPKIRKRKKREERKIAHISRKKIELCKRGCELHPENSTHMHILI